MTQLTILDVNIRQDAQGRYCLNDCHRSSGSEASKAPGQWMANKQTKALIAEIDTVEIPTVSETAGKSVVTVEGRGGGTYACKELIYAYAMWISPAFHLRVIRAFDAMMMGKGLKIVEPLSREQKINEAFLISQDIIREKDAEIAVLAPKAEALDALANLEGRHNLRISAAQCKWPERKFIDKLIQIKWIYIHAVTGRKCAYADKIKAGLMEVKNVEVKRTGYTEGVGQPMITQKGLARLRVILGVYQTTALARRTDTATHGELH
ncbi:KilA-N domain-containing protein [Neokomagataea anthophila]|uniref:KilA-N domain-containing protein n=1 Tax=Neokomagataea anthophila TaxID=2826925 RepID=A0ABS5E842_9PROT|nr:KilA-N domain-containing protein [Neokomagataea anthophila]